MRNPRREQRLLALGVALSFVVVLAPRASATIASQEIRSLAAGSGGVRFEVVVPEPSVVPVGEAIGAGFVRFELPGFPTAGNAGAPRLPERIYWVGVPEGAAVSARAVALESREYDGLRLAPRIPLSIGEGAGADGVTSPPEHSLRVRMEHWAASPEYLSATTGEPLVTVAGVTGMRSQRVAAIRLRPARYDAASGRVRLATRIAVEVSFSGGAGGLRPARDEPAFEPVYRSLLVNYESARAFRRAPGGVRRASSRESALEANGLGFEIATRWFRVRVAESGIQRISGEALQAAGVALSAVDPERLRIFTRPSVPLLDEDAFAPAGALAEVAIRVDAGGDGRLDPEDEILFYGVGASGWMDEFPGATGASAEWLNHPYETHNTYWLALDAAAPAPPLRWGVRGVAPERADAVPVPWYDARLHFEENNDFVSNLFEPGIPWDQWIWKEITDRLATQTFVADAPGAVETEPARMRARFWGASIEAPRTPGIRHHNLRVEFNGHAFPDTFQWDGFVRRDVDSTAIWIRERGNELRATVPRLQDPLGFRNDRQAFYFWELHFKRRFLVEDDEIAFRLPGEGPVAVGLAPFGGVASERLVLLDVTDGLRPAALTGWVRRDSLGGTAVYLHDDGVIERSFYGATARRFHTPLVEAAAIRSLEGFGADYLILVSDELEPQAEALAAHRRTRLPGFPTPRVEVVRISDVLAWYSGGRMDPTAIRNFLHDLLVNERGTPAPVYVCLFGDASYDFKDIFGRAGGEARQVPTYVHLLNLIRNQVSTDDWLADVDIGPVDPPAPGVETGVDDIPDFLLGRIPAADAAEASLVVDGKIIPYETQAEPAEWHNRTLHLADDTRIGTRSDPLSGIMIAQADSLIAAHLPARLDARKVYLIEFPLEGPEKPQAREALVEELNRGAVLWNFTGRGNPFRMTDENVFTLGDLPLLRNEERLTYLIGASASLSRFDDPLTTGLGEALLEATHAGAIATFSTTDVAFSNANFSLNQALLEAQFAAEEGGAVPIGRSAFVAKHRMAARVNDRLWALLGDPALQLAIPPLHVRARLIDVKTREPVEGAIGRGQHVRLEGEIHGTGDSGMDDLRDDFDGFARIVATDAPPLVPFPFFNMTRFYRGDAEVVLTRKARVKGGRLRANLAFPKDARLGEGARIRVYVEDGTREGSGALTLRLEGGKFPDADTSGPRVTLRLPDAHAPVLRAGQTLSVQLEDEHGIQLADRELHGRIQVRFDDDEAIDVTDRFVYAEGSDTRGVVEFEVPELAPGIHRISISVADNLAASPGERNRTLAVREIRVAGGTEIPGLAGPRARVQPNPGRAGEGVSFALEGIGERAELEVRIYSVTGRLVRTLVARGGSGTLETRWDGRDRGGVVQSAGIYLYRLRLRAGGEPAGAWQGRVALLR